MGQVLRQLPPPPLVLHSRSVLGENKLLTGDLMARKISWGLAAAAAYPGMRIFSMGS